jgi:hypothetical protein
VKGFGFEFFVHRAVPVSNFSSFVSLRNNKRPSAAGAFQKHVWNKTGPVAAGAPAGWDAMPNPFGQMSLREMAGFRSLLATPGAFSRTAIGREDAFFTRCREFV